MAVRSVINSFVSCDSYFFTDNNDISVYFKANCDDFYWKYCSDYQSAYLLIIHMLYEIKKYSYTDIIVHHNSRIVEEINNKIDPLNEWGNAVRMYLYRNVLPYFIDCSFKKDSRSNVCNAISEGGKQVNKHNCEISKSIIYNSRKRRIERFKNAYHR